MRKNINRYCKLEDFKNQAQNVINKSKENEFVFLALDFDNFKYINDLFGYEFGDKILKSLSCHFNAQLEQHEFFTRVYADSFEFMLKADTVDNLKNRILRFVEIQENLDEILPQHYSFIASGGFCYINHAGEKLSSIIDKANFARKFAKGNRESTVLHYDKEMQDELEWRKEITLNMENALNNKEYKMYLQPKYDMITDEIVGAEALVRWHSPERGVIYPDKFIPILEQNGFIKSMDFSMLHQACAFIRKIIDLGLNPISISVNFSKVHIKSPRLAQEIFNIVSQYNIPSNLIELEFTESVFIKNFNVLRDIASDLKSLGFKVSIDDFGSAYSSLNYLQDLPIDIIKIDKSFLEDANNAKSKLIIAKIVELIKSLQLTTVMEGIEDKSQAEYLKSLKCDIGQGYFFARPMPSEDFLTFLKDSQTAHRTKKISSDDVDVKKTHYGWESYALEKIDNLQSTLDCKIEELEILQKNIPGGVVRAKMNDSYDILYINSGFEDLCGYSKTEICELFDNKLTNLVYPEDLKFGINEIRNQFALSDKCKLEFRLLHKTKGYIWVLEQIQKISLENETVIWGVLLDITAEKIWQNNLKESQEKYKMIFEQSDDILFEWNFTPDEIVFSDKFRSLLGYDIKVENGMIDGRFEANIYYQDLEIFKKWQKNVFKKTGKNDCEFRIRKIDNTYIWVKISSSSVCDSKGNPIKAVGVISNIDGEKAILSYLKAKSQQDSLTKVYNKVESANIIAAQVEQFKDKNNALLIIDIDNFKGVNDNLGHQFGDMVLVEIASKLKEIYTENAVIGRLGGDEFVILMTDTKEDNSDVFFKIDKILNALHNKFYGESTSYSITASIGVATYPKDGENFEQLYKNADLALYESKRRGKNCSTFYYDNIEKPVARKERELHDTNRFLSDYFENDLIFNVFEMLYETRDIKTTVNQILAILGKKFKVDRVYIFEDSEDGKTCSNTYEWCAEGVRAEIDNLQNMTNDTFYLNSLKEDEIFYCNNIETLDQFSYEVLKQQNIKSILQCAFYSDRVFKGFIGFDDCKNFRDWQRDEIAILAYIAKVLSIFILNKHISNELWNSYQNYTEMLDNLNGYVYVIDNEHNLLYVNNNIIQMGLPTTGKCYSMAFDTDVPCANCPKNKITENYKYADATIFSKKLGCNVNSSMSKLKWTDGNEAYLILCTKSYK